MKIEIFEVNVVVLMSNRKITRKIDISLRNIAWLVDRFTERWNKEVKDLKEKMEKSRPNEDDYIYREVKDQVERIIVKGEEPDEATIEIHGVKIKKKIVHRKSEEYNGADVYVEVEGIKFALIQFKLASTNRFHFKESELANLEKWCNLCLSDSTRPISCASFVWLIRYHGDDYEKHRILKVCQLRDILKGRESAKIEEFNNHGITRPTFLELLANCWEGVSFQRKPSSEDLLGYAEALNRLLVAFAIEG